MSIFYYEEHASCKNYVTDLKVGFIEVELKAGEIIEAAEKHDNHIVFVLNGKISISYNEYKDVTFSAKEMCFLPKSADCRGRVLQDATIMALTYNNPSSLCDKMEFESLAPLCKKIEYNFTGLTIRPEMEWFLRIMSHYLKDGLNCSHMHEIKQKELFLLFRVYYTKDELAGFFYPSIGKSLEFKGLVMSNYLVVKSAKELADACGYTQRAFSRKFKDEFGEPPYTWMQKQIARHVKGRLRDKDIPYKTIASEFKFSSQEHLIKFCKAYLGGTPAQIRLSFMPEN